MGKNSTGKEHSPDKEPHEKNRIQRKKIKKTNYSPKTTQDDVIEHLEATVSKLRTDVFLEKVHKTFRQLHSKRPHAYNRHDEYLFEKLCGNCLTPDHDELLLLCDICDDAYHSFCLDPALVELPTEDEEWICPPCEYLKAAREAQIIQQQRQSTLNEHFEIESIVRKCHSCFKDIDEVIQPSDSKRKPSKKKTKEICIRCQNHFHIECFNQNKKSILCTQCETLVQSTVPKSEKTLYDFFTVKPHKIQQEEPSSLNSKASTEGTDSQISVEETEETHPMRLDSPRLKLKRTRGKKGAHKLLLKRKKTVFRLPKLSEDPKALLRQKELLAKALISKNITFDDNLCFSNPDCPPQVNNTEFEPNLQKMDIENIAVFKNFKEMTKNGNYAPLHVIEDKKQGFVVQAAEDIPRYTLISEYVGEVDFARNRLFDTNDSIMDLLRTNRSSSSLVICPESRGNIARFISGINNSKDRAQLKINVKSIRFSVEGHARVLLYAARNIKKGEILYYDYNAGGFNEYPTEDFV